MAAACPRQAASFVLNSTAGGPVPSARGTRSAWPAPFTLLVLRRGLVQPHAQAEAHGCQDLLDLVERLAAEVLGLEHLPFSLLHELANRPDVRVLQTVVGPDGELELLDALV